MNVPVPGLMDKLSRIKNSPITHDVLFESARKKDEFAKALVSLVGPIYAAAGMYRCRRIRDLAETGRIANRSKVEESGMSGSLSTVAKL
jgi:hypothetical protein